eukprot:SAG22_NODE_5585_length_989_cov_1.150562_2_plen_146_part_00
MVPHQQAGNVKRVAELDEVRRWSSAGRLARALHACPQHVLLSRSKQQALLLVPLPALKACSCSTSPYHSLCLTLPCGIRARTPQVLADLETSVSTTASGSATVTDCGPDRPRIEFRGVDVVRVAAWPSNACLPFTSVLILVHVRV